MIALPDDVIYHIFFYLSNTTLLSFCLTSKKQWHNKRFWYTRFARLPLRQKWTTVIDRQDVFNLIRYHNTLLTLDDYQQQLNQLTIIKHIIIKIDCSITLPCLFDKYIRLLFNHYITSTDVINRIQFLYNGYVWIWSYFTTEGKIYQHYNDDCENKMTLFLYKMIKTNQPINLYHI